MNNHILLVGSVAENIVIQKTKSGKDIAFLVLDVPRGQKATENAAEKDTFKIALWGNSAKNLLDGGAKVGSVVSVDGRLSSSTYTKQDGTEGVAQQIEADEVLLMSKEAVLYQGVNIIKLTGEIMQPVAVSENDKGKSTGSLFLSVPRFYNSPDGAAKGVIDEFVLPLKGKQLDGSLPTVFAGMMASVEGKLNGSSYYGKSHDKLYSMSVWVKEIVPFELNSFLELTLHNKNSIER